MRASVGVEVAGSRSVDMLTDSYTAHTILIVLMLRRTS